MAPQTADSLRIFSFKSANNLKLLIIINNIVFDNEGFKKLWSNEIEVKVRIEWCLVILSPTSGIMEKKEESNDCY